VGQAEEGGTTVKIEGRPYLGWAVLLGLVVLFFWREVLDLVRAWVSDPFVRYGFLIPLISLYLARKRGWAPPFDLRHTIPGLVAAFAGIGLLLAVRTYAGLSAAVVPFLLFVFGIWTVLYSWKGVREFWFPLAYLGFMFPLPKAITTPLSMSLSELTFQLTCFWLSLLGIRYEATYEVLPTITVFRAGEAMSFGIDISCVSVYALLGFLAFGVFFAYVLSGPLHRRLLYVLIGSLLLVLLNSLRIAIILGLAIVFGEGLAVELFHLFGGWVLIAVSFVVVLLLVERSGDVVRV
jgi:exosortase